MNSNIIHYGIGKDYLKSWGVNEGLREIFQNFLDYGDYKVDMVAATKGRVRVTISNDYVPEALEFLRIGYSHKKDDNALGKHGEGLKMAALIFARLDNHFSIMTKGKLYAPVFIDNGGMGECFAIKVIDTHKEHDGFIIQFVCDKEEYVEFIEGVITKNDVLYSNTSDGKIVDKPVGNIYCGGLFVANVKNLTRAYDIYPRNMELDRDRRVPRAIDIEYHTKRINKEYDKWTLDQQSHTDVKDIDEIPKRLHDKVSVVKRGDSHIVMHKSDNGEEKPIEGYNLQQAAKRIPHIAKAIEKAKLEKKRKRVKPHASCKRITSALTKFRKEHLDKKSNSDLDMLDIIRKINKKELT